LSEKIAGTNAASILAESTLDFIIECLDYKNNFLKQTAAKFTKKETDQLNVVLFSLIALEKYSMSSQNKAGIMKRLNESENYLLSLSEWHDDKKTHKRQIGFLSQYLLENIYIPESHIYLFTQINTNETNVKLNDDDTSENLKISPDGLEARNDTLTFESVRSTYHVDEGSWYYEVTLITNGIMQIGFANKSASFLNHQGCGIGDDHFSVGYDGCRNLIWYNASHHSIKRQTPWKEGDVIGFLLDICKKTISFYLNGKLVVTHGDFFRKVTKGIFPAASFMSYQQVLFNFGRDPFKYPPAECDFKNFNEFGFLPDEKKYVLPRRKKLELLRELKVNDDACSLCCENTANVILYPCHHQDICDICVKRLKHCPICRSNISKHKKIV
jgi:hypothetical protein